MIVLGIILFIIGIISLLILKFNNKISKGKVFLLLFIAFIDIALGMLVIEEVIIEKRTAIQCFRGKNPYKMEIRYEKKDSLYVPKDTVFFKIK
jgi:hypothetical protein